MTEPFVRFRLYVAGDAPYSQRAVANLHAFCRTHLPERHAVEIVDLLSQPERALTDMVLLTPTLSIVEPPPLRSIIGDLSDTSVLEHLLLPNRGGQ